MNLTPLSEFVIGQHVDLIRSSKGIILAYNKYLYSEWLGYLDTLLYVFNSELIDRHVDLYFCFPVYVYLNTEMQHHNVTIAFF